MLMSSLQKSYINFKPVIYAIMISPAIYFQLLKTLHLSLDLQACIPTFIRTRQTNVLKSNRVQ